MQHTNPCAGLCNNCMSLQLTCSIQVRGYSGFKDLKSCTRATQEVVMPCRELTPNGGGWHLGDTGGGGVSADKLGTLQHHVAITMHCSQWVESGMRGGGHVGDTGVQRVIESALAIACSSTASIWS